VLRVLQDLKQYNGTRGMASICIGGGQGGAVYLERVAEERV
jgi:acetyl-CoA C-acetyltransferase